MDAVLAVGISGAMVRHGEQEDEARETGLEGYRD